MKQEKEFADKAGELIKSVESQNKTLNIFLQKLKNECQDKFDWGKEKESKSKDNIK